MARRLCVVKAHTSHEPQNAKKGKGNGGQLLPREWRRVAPCGPYGLGVLGRARSAQRASSWPWAQRTGLSAVLRADGSTNEVEAAIAAKTLPEHGAALPNIAAINGHKENDEKRPPVQGLSRLS